MFFKKGLLSIKNNEIVILHFCFSTFMSFDIFAFRHLWHSTFLIFDIFVSTFSYSTFLFFDIFSWNPFFTRKIVNFYFNGKNGLGLLVTQRHLPNRPRLIFPKCAMREFDKHVDHFRSGIVFQFHSKKAMGLSIWLI